MPRIWKHIINITFGALLVCTLTGAYFLGAASRKPIRCKGLAITVTDSATAATATFTAGELFLPDAPRESLLARNKG